MGKVGLVTDSTCDLGPGYLSEHGVEMVPLRVNFGDDSWLDWVEMRPAEFFERLKAYPGLPKTSQPSPAQFTETYKRLAEQGCDEIVSIHLSAKVSGTFESAVLGAADSPVPVRCIDSKRVAAATAQVLEAAFEARDAGGDADAVEEAARYVIDSQQFYFILDTLDYLVKGGRAGKAQGLAAALLNIKPILTFDDDGVIEAYKKLKGTRKAMQEVAELANAACASGKVRLRFMHALHLDYLAELKGMVHLGQDCRDDGDTEVGAVIGAYAGPGAVGLAFYPVR